MFSIWTALLQLVICEAVGQLLLILSLLLGNRLDWSRNVSKLTVILCALPNLANVCLLGGTRTSKAYARARSRANEDRSSPHFQRDIRSFSQRENCTEKQVICAEFRPLGPGQHSER